MNIHWLNLIGTACFLAMTATNCAAQSSSIAPSSLNAQQTASFESIAQQVENPCTDPELSDYTTLAALLKDNKSCRAAAMLRFDIAYYLSHGLEDLRTAGVAKAEARAFKSPAEIKMQGRPRLGPENAPVQIVIFSDFQCPYCARAAAVMHQIAAAYPSSVSVVFKQLPLSNIHPYANAAALVTAYAQSKGRFWEIHDRFFNSQNLIDPAFIQETCELLGSSPEEVFDPQKGQPLGVMIAEDIKDAGTADVKGTPTVFINGVEALSGTRLEYLSARVEAELNEIGQSKNKSTKSSQPKILCDHEDIKPICASLDKDQVKNLQMFGNLAPCPCTNQSSSLTECLFKSVCPEAAEHVRQAADRIANGASQADLLHDIANTPPNPAHSE